VTGITADETRARCNNYCNLYVLKRRDYKELLNTEERIDF
jgi:hypothetical protein